MKRQKRGFVIVLLCAMVLGGCKGGTSENKDVESVQPAVTPAITEQTGEQQAVETATPDDKQPTQTPEVIETKAPDQKEESETTKTRNSKYKVVLKKGEVSSDGRFQVTYPQIKNWSNKEAMESWNQLFAAANYGSKDDGVDAYVLKTTVMTKNSELLSLLMEGSIKYEGIDETTQFAYTYNIDMKTGKSYRLKDSKADLSKIEDKLMNDNYEIVTENPQVSMVAVLDTLYLKNEKDDDVARVKEALKECDYDEDNSSPACYSYWKNGKVSLVFDVDEEIGGYAIFRLK